MNKFLLLAYFLCLTMFGLILLVFFNAVFSPTQSVTIFVNRQGEMLLEIIVMPIIFGFCLAIGLNELWRDYCAKV